MELPKEDKANEKFIVKYRQQLYDLSEFMHKHPGGINTLKGLSGADMTARFMKAPPHSDAAMYLMKEYKIDSEAYQQNSRQRPRDTEDNNNNKLDESMEVSWIVCF